MWAGVVLTNTLEPQCRSGNASGPISSHSERLMDAVCSFSPPGTCCFQSGARLREVLSYFFKATRWWLVVFCGSAGMLKATGGEFLRVFWEDNLLAEKVAGHFHTLSSLSSAAACWQPPRILSLPLTHKQSPSERNVLLRWGRWTRPAWFYAHRRLKKPAVFLFKILPDPFKSSGNLLTRSPEGLGTSKRLQATL